MKVVFPTEGSIIMLKQDVDTLQAFYNTNLMQSKMYSYYKDSDSLIQVGNLNYPPKEHFIVLYNAHPLTVEKMQEILDISLGRDPNERKAAQEETRETPIEESTEDKISDNDILSNPFFATLKQID